MRRRAVAVGALLCVSVGPNDGGLGSVEGIVQAPSVPVTDAVVYLEAARDTTYAVPDTPLLIDQRGLRFRPTVQVVVPGTVVEFRNSDPVLHNVFSPTRLPSPFNLGTYPRSQSRTHRFMGIGPHVILCHVHPEMVAHVLVVPTPHHAVVSPDGSFRIDSVPPGAYTLRVWHRRLRSFEQPISVPRDGNLILQLDLRPK